VVRTPDEFEIIEAIMRKTAKLPKGYSEIGDDVAVIPASDAKLVMKVDMLVESTDVPRGMSFRQAARKAVAMCVSDFGAKGVRPDAYMISLGLSRRTSARQIAELALGFRDASSEWGVKLAGGDTNEAGELVIDCAMAGFGRRVAGRSGARRGDVVVTTGEFGYPPAGLAILLNAAKATGTFRRAALEQVLMPTPDLRLGLALAPYWTSVMDSSDGLARSLHTLAKASRVGIEIHKLPAAEGLDEFARANGMSTKQLVLGGGEEYLLVGTMKESRLGAALTAAKRCGGRIIRIGNVEGSTGAVRLRSGGRSERVEDAGWTHLR
jgi:thiamine-monophosphate kinase